MKTISTARGDLILVDDCDFESLNRHKWRVSKKGYAYRSVIEDGKRTTSRMHREILGLARGDTRQADHKYGTKIDNRRGNLRICTPNENACNKGRRITNTSGFKGVSWKARSNRWCAAIYFEGRKKHLGYFDDPKEAHEVYCLAADMLHGEFANYGA